MNAISAQPATSSTAIESFLSSHLTLHALPDTTMRLIRMVNDPDCSIGQLQKLIQQDAALSARIIKTINSTYFALPNKVKRIDHAVTLLGLKAVKGVALSSSLESFCKPMWFGAYSARDLWNHSVGVAIMARELASKSGRGDSEELFLAGMLHDLSLLLATQSEPVKGTELFTAAENHPGYSFAAIEQDVFGFTHTQLGERLAPQWGFADDMAAVMRWHHDPANAPDQFRDLCRLIHVADTLTCEAQVGCPLTCKLQSVGDEDLSALGISRDVVVELTKNFRC